MIVKTKKYELPKKEYISTALLLRIQKTWWYVFGPLLIVALAFVFPKYKWWFIIPAILTVLGYVLFWAIQFVGVTQLPQFANLFAKMIYHIDSREIKAMLNQREGAIIKWDMIKSVKKTKTAYLLMMDKANFIQLPFDIFNSEADLKFMDYVLKQKNLI